MQPFNVPCSQITTSLLPFSKGISEDVKFQPSELGILPVEKVFPHYAVPSARKESFRTWPKYITVKPKDLAEAGFFYEGVGDTVKCYYCGGGLRYWDPGDEPWTEHAKWYPSCPHIALNKGAKFVEEVKNKQKGEVSANSSRTANIGVVSEPKESNPMDSSAVAAVREFVDDEIVIRQAVEYAIKLNHSKDIRSITALDLMKIIEDIREGKATILVGDETREHAETILNLEPGSIRKPTTGVEGNKEDIEKIQMEKQRLDKQKLCKICRKATAHVMFLPCRHCISCPRCAPALMKCPELFCMKKIKGLFRIVP
ncbi:hypothetical protein ACJMK2_028916 [Sinanodonta woodiana]|uniref:Uncharacterized protein n=1 Tax=Sinanodonta woodiana TaxID=1069815 RepID=A0ABD3XAD5_SINWO